LENIYPGYIGVSHSAKDITYLVNTLKAKDVYIYSCYAVNMVSDLIKEFINTPTECTFHIMGVKGESLASISASLIIKEILTHNPFSIEDEVIELRDNIPEQYIFLKFSKGNYCVYEIKVPTSPMDIINSSLFSSLATTKKNSVHNQLVVHRSFIIEDNLLHKIQRALIQRKNYTVRYLSSLMAIHLYNGLKISAHACLKAGANVNYVYSNRVTLIAYFLDNEDSPVEPIQKLIEWGYNVLLPVGGDTLLISATKTGNLEFVKLLISYGVNPNMYNMRGETPMSVSINKKYYDIVLYLLDLTKILDHNLLFVIASIGSIEGLKKLVVLGEDPKRVDIKGNNILHIASDEGNYDFISYCIKGCGVNINEINKDGCSPIVNAILSVEDDPVIVETVKTLIELGAQLNITDYPLIYTAINRGNYDIIAMLITAGVSIHPDRHISAKEYCIREDKSHLLPLFE
jgi:ankyrin repeat protein